MTPDQNEMAARRLCELRGIDPDGEWSYTQLGKVGHGYMEMKLIYRAEWERALPEIETHQHIIEAIQYGLTAA